MSYILKQNGVELVKTFNWSPRTYGNITGTSYPAEVTQDYVWENGDYWLGWVVDIIPEPLPPTLSELKARKNSEINQSRLSANQTTFTYLNKQIACDPLSRSDIDGINGYVATRGTLPPNWVGGWKAVDNSIVPIQTVENWNSFYDSMIAQGQANFVKSEGLKAQLAAATTAEQVAAIVW